MRAVELIAVKCKCRPTAPRLCRPDDPRCRPCARCQRCGKQFVRDEPAGFDSSAWEVCNDAVRMVEVLTLLGSPPSLRKRRLGACWVCRTHFDWCRNPRFLDAVAVGEAFADGKATERDRERAAHALRQAPVNVPWDADWRSAGLWCVVPDDATKKTAGLPALTLPAGWFREAFGDPFKPVSFDPNWRTSTVVGLASVMIERRQFQLFPYLCDALQDAGCDNTTVLAHCESSSPHGRGCWLLDAVLGMP